MEQTSSELTAAYKNKLVQGSSLIDCTGGFGVDAYYFSKSIDHVIHCESNIELSNIVKHNFSQLEVKNIDVYQGDSIKKITDSTNVDWIYIDPSRRNTKKGKVFLLEDCSPNIVENLEFFINKSNKMLLKTSPLLDIQSGIQTLKYTKEIHIVAVDNEVKELLWILQKKVNELNKINDVSVHCLNIKKDNIQKYSF